MRPIDFTSFADATPVISSDTISGMTVMRIALTQTVPMGETRSAASSNVVFPDAAIAAPTIRATISADEHARAFVHASLTS